MQLTITDAAIRQKLAALASTERVPIDAIAERVLALGLELPLPQVAVTSVPRQTAIDRNAEGILDLLEGNTGGLTVHDICGITGWCYMTGRKVVRHMLEKGLVDRMSIPTGGAPAWAYTIRPAAADAAPAVAAAPAIPALPVNELLDL